MNGLETLRPPLLRGGLESSTLEPPAPLGPAVARAHLGAALFGVAMATAKAAASPSEWVVWTVALPMVLVSTWLVCLPALYILWASREPMLRLPQVLRAAATSFGVTGACLVATAPVLWFFAVTAPESSVGRMLGLIFTWLAFISAGVSFGRCLRTEALELPRWALLAFFALYVLTFFQFSDVAGLGWFGV